MKKKQFEQKLPYLLKFPEDEELNKLREEAKYPFSFLIREGYLKAMLYFWEAGKYLDFIPTIVQNIIIYTNINDPDSLKSQLKHIYITLKNINYREWYTTNMRALEHFVTNLYDWTKNIEVYQLMFGVYYSFTNATIYTKNIIDLINSNKIDYNPNYIKYLKHIFPTEDAVEAKIAEPKKDLWKKINKSKCIMLTSKELNTYIEQVFNTESECKENKNVEPNESTRKHALFDAEVSLLNNAFLYEDFSLIHKLQTYFEIYMPLYSEIMTDDQYNFIYETLLNPLNSNILQSFGEISPFLIASIIRDDVSKYHSIMNLVDSETKERIYYYLSRRIAQINWNLEKIKFWKENDPKLF